MNSSAIVYYCNHCKKIFETVEDLYFVQDNSGRSFCSEECIEKFFEHLIVYYGKREEKGRGLLDLLNESCLKHSTNPEYVEKTLEDPDETWCVENVLKERIYVLISRFDVGSEPPFHLIISCFMFDGAPSFILTSTATSSRELLEKYRTGRKLENALRGPGEEARGEIAVDPEIKEALDRHHGILLSRVMELRSAGDIPYDDFGQYDGFYGETLQGPDEIYYDRSESDPEIALYSYIKAHEKDGTSFYYFVLCLQFENCPAGIEGALYPVLYFPSTDPSLYRAFKTGKSVLGNLKN